MSTPTNKTIFVRIAKQDTHDKFIQRAVQITTEHPEKVYFDEIDCVIWQNGHKYGFDKADRDFIILNKDKITSLLDDYDSVKPEYGTIKDALDTIYNTFSELDVWETYK